ncbi:MAG: type II toxin-antitoxin system VapC family toxin [Deltaproteobacteria bacterium]|nr:type II toxin-antitoxin system VapC family toxin [Deltaproteobacteria bacterium]
MIYIDTSVLLSYYCPEPLSSKAEKIIIRADSPVISPLTEVEFASALARKIREKEISTESSDKILNEFKSHVRQMFYRKIPIDAACYNLAFNWLSGNDTPLATLDSIHLAITSLNNLKIITADKQLARAAHKYGIDYQLL